MTYTYTPGPWNIFTDGTTAAGIVKYQENSPYNDGRDSVLICSFEGLCSHDETESNANLIAAAPELLEALEDVECNLGLCDLDDDTCAKIRAAIAKARGNNV